MTILCANLCIYFIPTSAPRKYWYELTFWRKFPPLNRILFVRAVNVFRVETRKWTQFTLSGYYFFLWVEQKGNTLEKKVIKATGIPSLSIKSVDFNQHMYRQLVVARGSSSLWYQDSFDSKRKQCTMLTARASAIKRAIFKKV